MTREEAAQIIDDLANSTAQTTNQSVRAQSGPVIGAVGIGTPGGGPGIVGIAHNGGVGFSAVAVSGDVNATANQESVTILRELATAVRRGDDESRIRALLGRLGAIAPALLGTASSALTMAQVVAG